MVGLNQHLLTPEWIPADSSRASLSGSAALELVPKQAAVLGSLKQLRGYFHPVIVVKAWGWLKLKKSAREYEQLKQVGGVSGAKWSP